MIPARRAASFSHEGIPRFLNVTGNLRRPDDWDDSDTPRLWRYNLHYFDDLNAVGASERTNVHRDLIGRWVNEVPPGAGTGWESYPCSLRIVNWIKWALAGNELEPAWRRSLALQAAWLAKNIEWHLLGNHLFVNAKALVFAGVFLEGEDAADWLDTGLKILRRELPEQVLEDGGQFERSPMYHVLAVEDVLDLVNLARAYPDIIREQDQSIWIAAAGRMLRWASAMRHPDQMFALFNDSAFGIAPELREIFAYAERLGVGFDACMPDLVYFEETGYVRASVKDAVLFADVGLIGPDYLPGHAHADTLGFELSLFEQRWFVDTGCSTYEVCEERLRQRGTAAHNTVCVDGEDSSEVWSSFRVARRARPLDVTVASDGGTHRISAGHDGYRRLNGKVTHSREFALSESRLVITDRLEGGYSEAVANFLLHPDVGAELVDNEVRLNMNGRGVIMTIGGGDIQVNPATWHPEFGLSVPTKRISVRMRSDHLTTELRW